MQNPTALPHLASQTGGLPSAVKWAQLLLADRLQPGDIALDATTGNGHDTLFLSQCVGSTGHVYGMDLQEAAIAETQRRLTDAGLTREQFTLIHAGHETMLTHIKPDHQGQISGIMFNLGYLPGSDKTVITRTETTLTAIQAALTLLKPGGLLTIAVYPGHEGGAEELREISAWAAALPARMWEVQNLRPVNRAASPPECWVVWKNPLSHGK